MLAGKKLTEVSADHPDHSFYLGKRYSAQYFARNVLPGVLDKADILALSLIHI